MSDAELVAQFMAKHAQLLARIVAQVFGIWDNLDGYDRVNVDEFVTAAVPVVQANQVAAGRLVDAFVAKMAHSSPVGVLPETVTDVRNGVTPEDVYSRPFLRVWRNMAQGMTPAAAVANARDYLGGMAQMDAQLATSHAMADVSERQPGVVGYRRVLTGKSCMFCASASTQRYKSGTLRPLHFRCDCGVAPIIGDRDPGRVINSDLLDNLKERGPRYWAKSGFVDPQGNPVDPTRLGRAALDHADEIGPVLATT